MLGILFGIFGNAIYDIIKGALKDSFSDKDENIIDRIYKALEEASEKFFDKYKDEFGVPSSSFLARQSNIDIIVKSMFYDNNIKLNEKLSKEGFDRVKDVTDEALHFFVDELKNSMLRDFELGKIICEKQHFEESRVNSIKMMDMIQTLIQQKYPSDDMLKEDLKGWILKDEQGNESKAIEEKQYIKKFSNGAEVTFMLKGELIYVEFVDIHHQKSYYEIDINGNVKNLKFPYELSEYKLVISEDDIVHKDVINLLKGYRREIIKLKWGKQADVIYDENGKLQNFTLSGGWEVKNKGKVIIPKKL